MLLPRGNIASGRSATSARGGNGVVSKHLVFIHSLVTSSATSEA